MSAHGGFYGTTLQMSSSQGNYGIVPLLREVGKEVTMGRTL